MDVSNARAKAATVKTEIDDYLDQVAAIKEGDVVSKMALGSKITDALETVVKAMEEGQSVLKR